MRAVKDVSCELQLGTIVIAHGRCKPLATLVVLPPALNNERVQSFGCGQIIISKSGIVHSLPRI